MTDLDRARRFYTEVFGFAVARELQPTDEGTAPLLRIEAPVGLNTCYLKRDDFVLELLHFADAGTVPGGERVVNQVGLTHLSLSVDDLEATLAAVEAHGGEVLRDTDLGGIAIFVKDPDGQLVELLTNWTKP